MESRSVWAGAASLGAVLVLLVTPPRVPSPAGTAPGAQQAAAPAAAEPATRDAGLSPSCPPTSASGYRMGCALLEEFLGERIDGLEPRAAPADSASGFELDVVIAILPDPADSHLDWAHDLYLEALRRGFESSGFVTDRFSLPARRDSVAVPLADTAGAGAGPAGARSRHRLAREVHPGVLLFRSAEPGGRALRLLYLVGEIPTEGIYKEALATALEERARLLGSRAFGRGGGAAATGVDTVRIVGPAFSGSVSSLAFALRHWLAGRDSAGHRVEIISGAATDLRNLDAFPAGGPVRFRATVNPDASLIRVLDETVRPRLEIPADQVLLLRESSTQYGRSDPGPGPETGPDAGAGSEPAAVSAKDSIHVLPFPMNISSLRTEYARRPRARAEGERIPGDQEQPRIPLSLQDSVRPRASPPVHSGLTAPATDLILDEVTRTLRTHKIRAVGILATDVRDRLFLADYVRQRVRDVQLFTFESNVLYLRSDFNRSLRGMLVFSSYPLFLENQWWTNGAPDRPRRELLPFGNEGAIGYYNATLMQLGRTERLAEYGSPGHPSGAGDSVRPPVWVTVVGNGSFLPLHVEPDTIARGYVAAASPRPTGYTDDRHPISFLAYGAWILLGLAIMVISGKLFWDAWSDDHREGRARPADRVPPGPEAPVSYSIGGRTYRAVESASLLIHREIYTLLLLVALAGVFLPPAIVIWKSTHLLQWPSPGAEPSPGEWGLGWTLIALGVAAWLLPLVYSLRRCARVLAATTRLGTTFALGRLRIRPERWSWSEHREAWLWALEVVSRLAVAVIGLAYFWLTLVFTLRIWLLGDPESPGFSLFFHRAIQLDSGVSPLPPLILTGAGLAVWSAWHLQRIDLLAHETTPFEESTLVRMADARDAPGGRRAAAAAPHEAEWGRVEEVRRRLFRLFPRVDAIVIALFLFLLGIWLSLQFGGTFESMLPAPGAGWPAWLLLDHPFGWLLKFGIFASLAATASAVYRLLSVWRALERFLEEVEGTDLRAAFSRLPRPIARLTRLTLFDPPSRAAVREAEREHWRQLHRIHEEKEAELLREAPERFHAPLIRVSRAASREAAEARSRRERSLWLDTHARDLGELRELLHGLWKEQPSGADIDKVVAALTGSGPAPGARRADDEGASTSALLRRSYAGAMGLWLRVAEELLAVSVVDYVEWVLRHLRRLTLFLLASLVLTTLLVSSYPFQVQSLVKLLFFGLVAATIASLVLVMNQMNRNDVLSRITRTDPGRVNWSVTYVTHLLLYGGVPLLAVISAEFPRVREALFSWLEPLIRTVMKV